jgi:predicted DCC family thiol-disulfide oxidoreductase YuxK
MGARLVNALAKVKPADGLTVVYDGECPFCSSYVRMLRLREAVGPVSLLDARQHGDVVDQLRAKGVEINQNMVVICRGAFYLGGEALSMLSALSSSSGLINRAMAALLRNPVVAQRLYPYLRGGRNLALKLLRRRPIF